MAASLYSSYLRNSSTGVPLLPADVTLIVMDPQSNPFAALSFIVAPAILTNASSVLTLSTSNRLARAVDRARELTTTLEATTALGSRSAQLDLQELAGAQQRMLMLIRALRAFYLALGGFASAALLSLLGAMLAPSPLGTFTAALELIVLVVGVSAVAALVRGALLLVHETRIAVSVLEERASQIQAEFSRKAQHDE